MDNSRGVYMAMANTLRQGDAKTLGIKKALEDMYPALARKVFDSTHVLSRLAMTSMNPMDLLDYPICGSCEMFAWQSQPVLRNGKYVDVCECDCGRTTVNPVSFRDWLFYELKGRIPDKTIQLIPNMIDHVAMRMVRKALADVVIQADRIRGKRREQMGLHTPDGFVRVKEDSKPKAQVQMVDPDKGQDILRNIVEVEDDSDV